MTGLSPLNTSRKVEAASDSLLEFDINEHVATIIRNLKVLHDDADFVDVTLTAKDSQSCIFHGVLLRAYNPSNAQSVYNVCVTADILKLLHAHVYRCSSGTIPEYYRGRIEDEFGIDVLTDDLQTISDNLVDLWNNKNLTDIELDTSDGVFVPCHACMLAASSPVFAEKIIRPNGFDRCITNVDFDSDIALKILSFVYTARVGIDDQTVGELLMAACTYQYSALVDACSDYMLNRITIGNAVEVLVLSNKAQSLGDYPKTRLYSQSFEFVIDRFSHVSKSGGFLELEGTILLKIISAIAVGSEEEILDAVLRWFAYAPERGCDDVDNLFGKIYFEDIATERLQHYQEMYAHFPKCTDRLKSEISIAKNTRTPSTLFPYEYNAYYPPGTYEPYEMTSINNSPSFSPNDVYGVDYKLAEAKEQGGNVCDTPKTKNGLPDMRFTNKSSLVLTKSGKPDMINEINKERVNDSRSLSAVSSAPELTKSGKPEVRFKENKGGAPPLFSSHETPPIGLSLKADGTPDMRYKDNKMSKSLDFGNKGVLDDPQHEKTTTGPLKKNDTPDRRYLGNKTAIASIASKSGSSCGSEDGPDDFDFWHVMPFNSISSHITSNTSRCGPLKKDGTSDMRCNTNEDNFVRGRFESTSKMKMKTGGCDESTSGGSSCISSDAQLNNLRKLVDKIFDESRGYTGSSLSGVSSCSSSGPLKKDGTPNMGYTVNKEVYGSKGYTGSSSSGASLCSSNYACGPLKKDGNLLQCDSCQQPVAMEKLLQCVDAHLTCGECMEKIAKEAIKGKKRQFTVDCPVLDCGYSIPLGNKGVLDDPQHESCIVPLATIWVMDDALNMTSNSGSSCGSEDGSDDFDFSDVLSFNSISSHIISNTSRCGPLKKDGTPDMRCNTNEANVERGRLESTSKVKKKTGGCDESTSGGSSCISSDAQLNNLLKQVDEEVYVSGGYGWSSSSDESSCDSTYARGPLKKDGTPNMGYTVNKKVYGSKGYTGSSSSGASLCSSTYACGPLKKDGTLFPCDSCQQPVAMEKLVQCADAHLTCGKCMEKIAKVAIKGKNRQFTVDCPVQDCGYSIPLAKLCEIMPDFIVDTIEERMMQEAIQEIEKATDIVKPRTLEQIDMTHNKETFNAPCDGGCSGDVSRATDPTLVNLSPSSTSATGQNEECTLMPCDSCQRSVAMEKLVQCVDAHITCGKCMEKIAKEAIKGKNRQSLTIHLRSINNFSVPCRLSQNAKVRLLKMFTVDCPVHNCGYSIPLVELRKIMPEFIVDAIEERIMQESLKEIEKAEGIVKCPHCNYMAELDAAVQVFGCIKCLKSFCRYCKKDYTGPSNHKDCKLVNYSTTSDAKIPTHWQTKDPSKQGYVKVTLDRSSAKHKQVAKLFRAQMHMMTIRSIERVENPRLWRCYSLHRDLMAQKNGMDGLNEMSLFHGTHPSIVDQICEQNFDFRLSGNANGTVYGRGTYFAKYAGYSHGYVVRSQPKGGQPNPSPVTNGITGVYKLIMARVLIGKSTLGDYDMLRPPAINPEDPGSELYDSCVDDEHSPEIFVTFERWQSYPEYIITYCQT